jgi:predicted amidohydrolase
MFALKQKTSNIMRLTLATVQTHAVPPRVRTARKFVQYAVEQGAKVVTLPEFFNIGCPLNDTTGNYAALLAGVTAAWLCDNVQRQRLISKTAPRRR